MDPKTKEDAMRLAVEGARKKLADGTWPQVMAVFEYENPKAPRVADEEFARLQAVYQEASCPNMATFIEYVQFTEKERGVTISFNFSMRRRETPGDAPPTPEQGALFLSCPDVLVGTRMGVEGAMAWFQKFAQTAIPTTPPELIQIMDKIFGEAVVIAHGCVEKQPLEEFFRESFSDEELPKRPEVPKH